MKEAAAAAAVRLGDFDSHHAEIEQPVDERTGKLRVLVHLADERTDFGLGEGPHAIAEQHLVFGERGQRRRGHLGLLLGHSGAPWKGTETSAGSS